VRVRGLGVGDRGGDSVGGLADEEGKMKIAFLVCLIIANLLSCVKNKEDWREGRVSLLLAFCTVLNPTAAVMCLLALIVMLT